MIDFIGEREENIMFENLEKHPCYGMLGLECMTKAFLDVLKIYLR